MGPRIRGNGVKAVNALHFWAPPATRAFLALIFFWLLRRRILTAYFFARYR